MPPPWCVALCGLALGIVAERRVPYKKKDNNLFFETY